MHNIPDHIPPHIVVDFDLYNPPGLDHGFHKAWLDLHRNNNSKLLWTFRNGGHWIVNDGELVKSLYADFERLSSRVTHLPRERSLGNNPIPASLDPPEQTAYRTVINAALSPKVARNMEEEITKFCISLIEDIAPRGECEFVDDFALRLPLELFMSFANLPKSDIPKLRYLAEQKMRPSTDMTAGEVQAALIEYLEPFLKDRRETPGEDLLSTVATGRIKNRQLTYDETGRMCAQLLVAGLDTVAAMLAFIFLHLSNDDILRRKLRDDPSLIPQAIEEFLRRFPLVSRVRELDADITVDDITMRAGDLMLIPTILHGLDEKLFANPEEIDLDRPQQVTSTFGHGPHRCPGAFIARTELRIVLNEWLKRIPDFTVDESRVDYRAGQVASIARLPMQWH